MTFATGVGWFTPEKTVFLVESATVMGRCWSSRNRRGLTATGATFRRRISRLKTTTIAICFLGGSRCGGSWSGSRGSLAIIRCLSGFGGGGGRGGLNTSVVRAFIAGAAFATFYTLYLSGSISDIKRQVPIGNNESADKKRNNEKAYRRKAKRIDKAGLKLLGQHFLK